MLSTSPDPASRIRAGEGARAAASGATFLAISLIGVTETSFVFRAAGVAGGRSSIIAFSDLFPAIFCGLHSEGQ